MKYYLFANFDTGIVIQGQSCELLENVLYEMETNEEMMIDIIPKNCMYLGYKTIIKGCNIFGGNIRIIRLSKCEIFIEFCPIIFNAICSEIVSYKFENYECIVKLFIGNCLEINYKNIFKSIKLIGNNYKVKIYEKKLKQNFLFVEIKNDNCCYLIIINDLKIIFENYIKEININEKIILLIDNKSCLGQKYVYEIDGDTAQLTDYLIEYQFRDIDIAKSPEISFLDSLKIKNYKLVSQCVNMNIGNEELACLSDFIGDFDEFLCINNHYVLIKNFEAIKSLNFEICNSKIINIIYNKVEINDKK